MYYTGIGSRDISVEEDQMMQRIARYLGRRGFILRSGKAAGSDTSFEKGHREVGISSPEIYIPWANFKGGTPLEGDEIILPKFGEVFNKTVEMVNKIHPAPEKLSQGALKLHQRNCFQVLGFDLDTPSTLLIACGKEDKSGDVLGGTRTAWMIAKQYNIPCLNVRGKTTGEIEVWLKEHL